MDKRNYTIAFLFFIIANYGFAQQKDAVLLTIEDEPVYASEFKHVYLKNIDLVKDESQKDVDEYLQLFINYKLKIKEAEAKGLDQKENHKKELAGYRKQLSANYLTDPSVSEELIKEAYDRSIERVNASHILIKITEDAVPIDTLNAYNKLMKIRERIIKGEDFKTVAQQNSEDPSAKRNNGDLGWFSAFRMVYPFEEAAFNTPIGDLSMPFRTRFGYHILKVNKKEKLEGEVTVAHIMIASNDKRTPADAKQKIDEIATQLKEGASFETLAKQYSDDRNTAINGGQINRFGKGALNSEKFERTAFSLQEIGEISTPIQSSYGWHIIKLIKKHELPSFEAQKNEITKKVKRDSRSQLITTSFTNSLKKKYQVKENKEGISFFKQHLSSDILLGKWKENIELNSTKELLTIAEKKYTYKDFATYLRSKSLRRSKYKSVSMHVEEVYKKFEGDQLLAYYEANLERDNKEFAQVYEEYRNGLLLFDLMESKIWNKAKDDSLGLKNFYQSHIENYQEEERYRVLKASSGNKKVLKKVKELLAKGTAIQTIKNQINKGDQSTIIFSEETITKEDTNLPKGFKGEKGLLDITEDKGYYTLIEVKEVLAPHTKSFEDTKGKVISDYQGQIEKDWLVELQDKYAVIVKKKALKKIKKELRN